MPMRKMKEFLDSHDIEYLTVSHSPAYTAMETAHIAHILGQELAKVVMVKLDGRMAMVVLPATRKVSLEHLKAAAEVSSAQLASEGEFSELFPDCEAGAMPPFGNLYGLPVFVDEALQQDEQIAFNAGSHSELVRLAYADFVRLVEPTVATLSEPMMQMA